MSSEDQDKEADEVREAINNAYAFVEGQKDLHTFRALTPEECFDKYIERVEGKGTIARPNELDRIAALRDRVRAAVTKVKTMPPEHFQYQDPKKGVNTKA